MPVSKYKFFFHAPYIYHCISGEKLLKYQEKSSWVIIFSVLVISLIDKSIDITRRKFDADH